MRWRNVGHAVTLVVIGLSTSGRAADHREVAQALAGPFLAEDIAAACSLRNPEFFAVITRDFPNAHAFAQHVEKELTDHLSDTDTALVVRLAADQARARARNAIRSFSALDPHVEDRRVQEWCDTSGRRLVSAMLAAHRRSHQPSE